jgi:hypothetical protein
VYDNIRLSRALNSDLSAVGDSCLEMNYVLNKLTFNLDLHADRFMDVGDARI